MSKRPSPPPLAKRTSGSAPAPVSTQTHSAALRETIESIAIAFVLAFLFRTFEAEAFVIPTGSMAPTLMGRHKDLSCPKCGNTFQVSASEEVSRDGGSLQAFGNDFRPEDFLIDRCVCPMCRYQLEKSDGPDTQTSFNGDRILVNKFAYQFASPQRWDVLVFKFPQKAQENYIKRLIGLPGETIRLSRGDVWVKSDDGDFEIARKPSEKLRVMLQPVFNNDLTPKIAEYGWPKRWQPQTPDEGKTAGNWTTKDSSTFETDGTGSGKMWLNYQHLVPRSEQWQHIKSNSKTVAQEVQPQLITDFTGYNTGSNRKDRELPSHPLDPPGLHWVGDLAVQCEANVANEQGQIVLKLVKGGREFFFQLDVGSGQAELSIEGLPSKNFNPRAQTKVRGPGKYSLMFANCDQKLYAWIDDEPVVFDMPTEYPDLKNSRPTPADLEPVGIASSGVKMTVGHLKISRDLYYIAANEAGKSMVDYKISPRDIENGELDRFFSSPSKWKTSFSDSNMRLSEFPFDRTLGPDEFFALGDNSAKSADGRIWGTIPRSLLIGKAFYVYWPHSWDRVPGTKIPFPFFPNFARMGFVR